MNDVVSNSSHSQVGAYVFISNGDGDINELRHNLLKINGVKLVHLLVGPTDMITYIESTSLADLRKVLDFDIRELIDSGKIRKTKTELILQGVSGYGFKKSSATPPFGSAWIFISLSIGDPDQIISELINIPGVVNAHAVIGDKDIIAYVERSGIEDLVNLIDVDIRNISGISNTDTRLVLMKPDNSNNYTVNLDKEQSKL